MPWPGYVPDRPSTARLLQWSWALEQLRNSRRFWLATAGTRGTPHLSAVWGAWSDADSALAFSTGRLTRKARDLAAQPRCSMSTESGESSVVLHGLAQEVTDGDRLAGLDAVYTAKYGSTMLIGDSPVFLLVPSMATGIIDSNDLTVIPTRWRLGRERS
jgi:hypothetical protein